MIGDEKLVPNHSQTTKGFLEGPPLLFFFFFFLFLTPTPETLLFSLLTQLTHLSIYKTYIAHLYSSYKFFPNHIVILQSSLVYSPLSVLFCQMMAVKLPTRQRWKRQGRRGQWSSL